MKKNKLSLNELHVQSFVTSAHENPATIKGGVTEGCGQTFDYCNSVPVNNCNIASYNANCPTVPVTDCNVPVDTRVKLLCQQSVLECIIAHSIPCI